MPQLTRLARNCLIATWSLLLYAVFGGFSNALLSFFVFSVPILYLTYLLSIPKNEDMDMLTSLLIHGRGSICPPNETPVSLLQNGLVYFEGKLNWDEVRQAMVTTYYKYKRMSHIAVKKTPQTPGWETRWQSIEITEEVINRQIVKMVVNNNDELYKLLDDEINQHLPRDLPLWKFYYIENNNGLSCWCLRVSHGIADGLRLVPVAAELLQNRDGSLVGVPTTGKLQAKSNNKAGRRPRINWFNPKTYFRLFDDIYKIWYLTDGPCDTLTPFKRDSRVHGSKYQTHLRNKVPFKIADIKALKNKYQCSFNDVITALTVSGIRSYILAEDADFFKRHRGDHVQMTSLLAFGFPPKEPFLGQHNWLCNGFSLAEWPFPVSVADFGERLKVISRNSQRLKSSMTAPIALALTTLIARLGIEGLLDESYTKTFARSHCVFSSLPSWSKPCYFNGVKVAKMEASYFNWIPQFIFMSYDDSIYGTLGVDLERFPNAQLILDGMNEELNRQMK